VERTPLLLYLGLAGDPQRAAVAPALAAAAERAGWAFELYYDDFRTGRHFGGGDPDAAARPGHAAGSLVAGGRHAEHLLWLGTRFELVALGDPCCLLWPALTALGAETLAATADPAELFEAAFDRLGQPLPRLALVLDGRPQGPHGLVTSPYVFPSFFAGEPALGIDVSSDGGLLGRLERLGIGSLRGLYLEPERAAALAASLDSSEGNAAGSTYASLTAELAKRHAGWGQGVLLGDPKLVAAQLPKARRLRLLPLYGQPQTDVIERCEELVRRAREPVFGRQYDDHDFFALARLGHGLQVLDPDPPFDAACALTTPNGPPPKALSDMEPDDAQLQAWADEGRILLTLLFWTGMVRELHCIPPLLDLAAATGLRGGLLVTAETVEHADGPALALLSVPVQQGGVFGLLEPLLASTGRGVAAEALLPPGTLAAALGEARAAAAKGLPHGMEPRGWWPLLDTELVPRRPPRLGRRAGRPVVFFTPRGGGAEPAAATRERPGRRDLRGLAANAVHAARLDAFFEERRPFEHVRPGAPDRAVAEAVRSAGFSYMWTKATFGAPAVPLREQDFVALSLTAGNWDGWSPFYTVGAARDLERAERRLRRSGGPGWLAATVDSPLWLLPGELLERSGELYRIATLAAEGGKSGQLVNVTPNVVARYARLLDDRGALNDRARNRSR
jgi:hypothetical protein